MDAPFQTPLTPRHFRTALQRGHGRAFLHVQRCGLTGVEEILIEACLHNWVYDLLCEGGREEWLAELIDASGRGPELMARLIPELDQPCPAKDAWQRCGLAMLFAKRGAPGAREALYRCVRKLPDDEFVLGGGELVELDGAAGLTHYAGVSGDLILNSGYLPVWDWPLSYFDEKYGAGAGRKVLDDAAKHSQEIRAFVQALDELARKKAVRKEQPYLERVARLSVDELLRKAEGVKSFAGLGFLRVWGRKASEADLKTVFELLAAESDPQRLRRLLMIFEKRAWRNLTHACWDSHSMKIAACASWHTGPCPITRMMRCESWGKSAWRGG